jgi:CysZ protein
MQALGFEKISPSGSTRYIPLTSSIAFLFGRKRLVGLSILLFLITILLTWLGYRFSLGLIDHITGSFFVSPPETAGILDWLQHKGRLILKWLYLFITRIVAFYLAFIVAYTLTTPGYALLSTAAEKLQAGDGFEMDDGLSFRGIAIDLWEGLKIAGFGIIVTIAALAANFIPVFGQVIAFLLLIYYSALMFLDYPASRRRWSLGRKIAWLKRYKGHSFRLGLFPALVSMIPLLNIFLIAMLFPLLTVHATLNFTALELSAQKRGKGSSHGH